MYCYNKHVRKSKIYNFTTNIYRPNMFGYINILHKTIEYLREEIEHMIHLSFYK